MAQELTPECLAMQYERFPAKTDVRRSFAITMGLIPGYGNNGIAYIPCIAENAALAWMKEKAANGQEYLTGIFTRGNLAYAWNSDNGPVGKTEPALIFTGEVSVCYNPDTPDERVEAMLNELATRFGITLGQTRVYVSYKDKTWVMQAKDKESPRAAEVKSF